MDWRSHRLVRDEGGHFLPGPVDHQRGGQAQQRLDRASERGPAARPGCSRARLTVRSK
jgi:hypothetical protein